VQVGSASVYHLTSLSLDPLELTHRRQDPRPHGVAVPVSRGGELAEPLAGETDRKGTVPITKELGRLASSGIITVYTELERTDRKPLRVLGVGTTHPATISYVTAIPAPRIVFAGLSQAQPRSSLAAPPLGAPAPAGRRLRGQSARAAGNPA
jgi:hypothetical protein